jgi:sugar phosphate isomerase/epimerase
MERRDFIQNLAAAAAGGLLSPSLREPGARLKDIGLELYSVRHAMAKDPERTMAAVRAIGYTQVELLWSMNNFDRTPEQVLATLKHEGLRAPSAHISPEILTAGWEKALETAQLLGHQFLVVPSLPEETSRTLDDWRAWADRFNTAGAVARRAGIWLAFHSEPEHMKPIEGAVPFDVFVERLDPRVTRLQPDTGNMVMGGADPMQYLARFRDRIVSFHLKDVKPDHSGDTELGRGVFDFKRFLAAVPALDEKPCYVEQEGPADELGAAGANYQYLRQLEF